MVSIGTFLSIGIIGAVAIGGYALYRNLDKAGGALSRGVEQSITNPLGNYFENLWTSLPSAAASTGNGSFKEAPPQQSGVTYEQYVAGEDTRTQSQVDDWYTQNKITNPNDPKPLLTPSVQIAYADPGPAATPKPTDYKSGYYYFDVAGSQYDTIQYQTAEAMKKLFSMNLSKIFSPGGLENITYIGQSNLNEAGFKLFGQSKGYL